MSVDDGQDAQLLACRQLIVDKIHCPDIVRLDGLLAILPKLRFHPSLGVLVPELKAQLIVNPACLLHIDQPALTAKQHMNAPVAVANPRLADLLDP